MRLVSGAPMPEMVWSLAGLERLRLVTDGAVAHPPLWQLIGLRAVEFGPGSAVFTLAQPPHGVSPGLLAMAVDAPLGSAVHATLGVGERLATAEMTLYVVPGRPPLEQGDAAPAAGGALVVSSRLLYSVGQVAASDCTVTDSSGRLVAHATCRCVVLPAGAPPTPFAREDLPPVPLTAPGEPVDPAELTTQADGRVTLTAGRWLANLFGGVQGGVVAHTGHVAATRALPDDRPDLLPASLTTSFLRPVATDGSTLRAEARLVHVGRTSAVVATSVLNAAGKVAATGRSGFAVR